MSFRIANITRYSLAQVSRFGQATRKEFSEFMVDSAVPYFDAGSEAVERYERFARRQRIAVHRYEAWMIDERDLDSHPAYYLTLKTDRDSQWKSLRPEFMDYSGYCEGDEAFLCRSGARQAAKVTVDARRSHRHDLMFVPNLYDASVILVSRRLRDCLIDSQLSGFHLVPCLVAGREHSPLQRLLTQCDRQLEEEATHFQLIPEARIRRPFRVGSVTFNKQCGRCGRVHLYESDTTSYLRSSDLRDLDVQLSIAVRYSRNRGFFKVPGEGVIVSPRFLRVLLGSGAAGWDDFSAAPPIKYGAVEIR